MKKAQIVVREKIVGITDDIGLRAVNGIYASPIMEFPDYTDEYAAIEALEKEYGEEYAKMRVGSIKLVWITENKSEKLKMHTPNLVEGNIEKIAALFPNVVTERIIGYKKEVRPDGTHEPIMERAIDFDALRQELSDVVVEGPAERYAFTWPDKRKIVLAANAPIAKTLRPCREESVDFDTTENLYIEGDNLDALKLMLETYLGRVKMIYIDPPYNTGYNLIYHNNFHKSTAEYMASSGQCDDEGNSLIQNPDTNGRFHTDWLNMMYPRLRFIKELLSRDGVLVCAIDENEFATLSLILKEIFSEGSYEHSYVSVVHNPRGQQGNNFSYVNEYLIFIYPADGRKYIADFPKEEVDARNLRDSGTDSDRVCARNCFYPFIVKYGEIVAIGDVPPVDFHPSSANVHKEDGSIEVWPLTDNGDEKKWRYARQSVDGIRGKLVAKSGRASVQIIYNKSDGTMRSVWVNARYDASEYGTKLVQSILGDSSFTYPKSLYAVLDAVKAGTLDSKDSIILDFFSGSATTAHAVMMLNAEDGGRRKFIMVQVPERIDENAEAYKSGFHTICDIGKERIRRAGAKIKADNPLTTQDLDVGFRVLRVDSSNMRDVYYTPDAYEPQNLLDMAENIKADRTPEDLLFQVMLDLGVLLSSKIEETEIGGKKVFRVADGYLIACFDSAVTDETVAAIAQQHPYYAVFRDSGFSSDSTATNFEQIFATYSPSTIKKVL